MLLMKILLLLIDGEIVHTTISEGCNVVSLPWAGIVDQTDTDFSRYSVAQGSINSRSVPGHMNI